MIYKRVAMAFAMATEFVKGIGESPAKIFVLRPEGVQRYVERAKTEIENDFNLMEKFAEFQP